MGASRGAPIGRAIQVSLSSRKSSARNRSGRGVSGRATRCRQERCARCRVGKEVGERNDLEARTPIKTSCPYASKWLVAVLSPSDAVFDAQTRALPRNCVEKGSRFAPVLSWARDRSTVAKLTQAQATAFFNTVTRSARSAASKTASEGLIAPPPANSMRTGMKSLLECWASRSLRSPTFFADPGIVRTFFGDAVARRIRPRPDRFTSRRFS